MDITPVSSQNDSQPATATPPEDASKYSTPQTEGPKAAVLEPQVAPEEPDQRRKTRSSHDEISLTQCLESYTAVETLADPFTCQKCQAQRVSSKQLTINQIPNVLVLHLKRFDARRSRKVEAVVNFPVRGLNMAPYIHRWRAQAEVKGEG